MSGHVSSGVSAASLVKDGTVAELQVQAGHLGAVHATLHAAAATQHTTDTAAVADLQQSTTAAGEALSGVWGSGM